MAWVAVGGEELDGFWVHANCSRALTSSHRLNHHHLKHGIRKELGLATEEKTLLSTTSGIGPPADDGEPFGTTAH